MLQRHLKLGVCGRLADMSLTTLMDHACLSVESELPCPGIKFKRKWFSVGMMAEGSFCRGWYQHVAWMIQVIWALKALPEQVHLARNPVLPHFHCPAMAGREQSIHYSCDNVFKAQGMAAAAPPLLPLTICLDIYITTKVENSIRGRLVLPPNVYLPIFSETLCGN